MGAEGAPGDFGSRLREARERRGVTLRQIANATKISVGVLEALERNDISRLPGGIFSRAFVRSYASQVGLDPEPTVREFIAAFPEDSVAAGHPTAPIEDSESIESERQTATTFAQLIVLSAVLAATIWLFQATRGQPAPDEAPVTASETPAAVVEKATPGGEHPAVAIEKPVAAVAKPVASGFNRTGQSGPSRGAEPPASVSVATAGQAVPASNADPGRPPLPEPVPADRLSVGLSVTRPCWISLTVDGDKAIEKLLRPGDQRTLDVQREMVLTAGDAAAVALTINGVPTRPLGRAGQVVTARFNLANFKDFLRPQ